MVKQAALQTAVYRYFTRETRSKTACLTVICIFEMHSNKLVKKNTFILTVYVLPRAGRVRHGCSNFSYQESG